MKKFFRFESGNRQLVMRIARAFFGPCEENHFEQFLQGIATNGIVADSLSDKLAMSWDAKAVFDKDTSSYCFRKNNEQDDGRRFCLIPRHNKRFIVTCGADEEWSLCYALESLHNFAPDTKVTYGEEEIPVKEALERLAAKAA